MEFSEQIIQVLDALCKKFGIAVDWTQQNIVPYFQALGEKFIRYEIISSAAYIMIFTALLFVSYRLAMKFHKTAQYVDYDIDNLETWIAIVVWVIFCAFAIIAVIVVIRQVFDIITCLSFPEKMLAEYILSLAGNS